jgi:hypothetical protein
MPGPQYPFVVMFDQPMNSPQLDATEPQASLKSNRIEPVLGDIIASFDMNMRRLLTVSGVEEEPIGTDAEHRRHAEV